MSDTRLAPGEVIFILTLVAPGEVVHGAGLSMALLTSSLHQAKADHHLNRLRRIKKIPHKDSLTLKSLAVLVPM